MNVAVFGLGYVGSVTAASLAAAGHQVIGVEVDPQKLSLLQQGQAPVSEPDLDGLMERAVRDGRLVVTDDTASAVHASDVSLVCVGTPSRRNGSLDRTYLEHVIERIGAALARTERYHVVAIRSTLLPGVLAAELIPLLQRASGRRVGENVGVCVNPEFLREGSAVRDFNHPPFTVIGESDPVAGDTVAALYAHTQARVHRVRPDEASMLKYASNNFHAMKVAFANEIGAICEQLGVDGQNVMRIFCEDKDLNISPRYLRPGFAFGGSCLPKDLRATNYLTKELDIAAPLLGSIIPSNDAQIQRIVDMICNDANRRVALIGLSFKSGTDDLRESPFVRLAEALIGKGVLLRVYDPDVAIAAVFGRNRAYLNARLPHVARLLGDRLPELIAASDTIIVGKSMPEVVGALAMKRPEQTVIDLVGIPTLSDAIKPWAGRASIPFERV